jgi:hypothetical protein
VLSQHLLEGLQEVKPRNENQDVALPQVPLHQQLPMIDQLGDYRDNNDLKQLAVPTRYGSK